MKTPISSPTASTSNGRRGGKNLSVHFQTISPATSSDESDREEQPAQNPEEASADSFLRVLELIWTTEVYQKIMEKLKFGEQIPMMEKNLSLKREFSSLISLWKTILKLIVHRMRAKQCAGLSWNVFRTILCDSELYTTCLQFKMSDTAIKIFHEYVSKEEMPVVASKGPSSSSQTMGTTTSMSYMTAPITETHVDVNESKKLDQSVDSLYLIEDFFGLQNAPASTGSISQSISRQANGKQYILKSPGECGLNVIKLEIYPFAKIVSLDKKNWCKHAETKILFLTNSNVDPIQTQLNKLQNMIMKAVTKIKNIQKEVKEINYWSSFGGFQQRP
ncbi:unnamed protein product [Euphydryas editha]|uniref:Uncharacterized protein n=1 Tax=Euphydryas editha TaxID=104508 RepID=A0AAU9TLK0_EUPED|nr:unnamed protein product [Euphydryas editha]